MTAEELNPFPSDQIGLRDGLERLETWGVSTVVAAFSDNSGITRAKAIPSGRLSELCTSGIGISKVLDVYTTTDEVALGGQFITTPVGDLRLVGDARSLRWMAPSQSAWISVDQYWQEGTPFPACQRTALRDAVDAATSAGFALRVGSEFEWTLFDLSSDHHVAHAGPAYGAQPILVFMPYLREIFDAMVLAGFTVEQLHAEYGKGQFELSVGHMEPMAAADSWILIRELIRVVSLQHGYRASFSPVPILDSVGNGAHLHVSAYRAESNQNLFFGSGRWDLDQEGEQFLAGIIDALPSLRLLGAPGPLSPARLKPSNWAGAYACWGIENREAAIRLIRQGQGSNAELKFADTSMNPYVFLAGVIYSGLNGVKEAMRLPEPIQSDPAKLAEHLQPAALPRRLSDAVAAFEANESLQADLGAELADTYLAVRTHEIQKFSDLETRDLIELLRWRY